LVVARTFSKAFGLAGLRVGAGIAHASVIGAIERARGPYTLNALAEAGAVAALGEGLPWVTARVADAIASRVAFAEALRGLGYHPLPSAANFLLVPVPEAVALAGALQSAGLIVRVFRHLPGIGNALRITAGPWPVMERVLAVFRSAA
jgi:histidinol-phosphate aminotransferase